MELPAILICISQGREEVVFTQPELPVHAFCPLPCCLAGSPVGLGWRGSTGVMIQLWSLTLCSSSLRLKCGPKLRQSFLMALSCQSYREARVSCIRG